jgi:hypothetical protein
MIAPPTLKNRYFGRAMRLGWNPTPPERLKRVPHLERYVKMRMGAVPPLPTNYRANATKSLAAMLLNDRLSDCTIAAVGHQVGVESAARPGGRELVMLDAEASSAYTTLCGAGDNGCYIPDVLDGWMKNGIVVNGQLVKIGGYALVDAANVPLLQLALYLFGPLHFGFMLTQNQYTSASPGATWQADGSPIVGGHSVAIVDADPDKWHVSTWGIQLLAMIDTFTAPTAQSECYVVLSDQWASAGNLAANGVDVATLAADMAILKSGGTPPLPTSPPPPPPPAPGGAGALTADGTIDITSAPWKVHLDGTVATAPTGTAGAGFSIWTILGDVAKIIADGRSKNWTAVAADVAQLLTDLGVVLPQSEMMDLADALMVHAETMPLGLPAPPR